MTPSTSPLESGTEALQRACEALRAHLLRLQEQALTGDIKEGKGGKKKDKGKGKNKDKDKDRDDGGGSGDGGNESGSGSDSSDDDSTDEQLSGAGLGLVQHTRHNGDTVWQPAQ